MWTIASGVRECFFVSSLRVGIIHLGTPLCSVFQSFAKGVLAHLLSAHEDNERVTISCLLGLLSVTVSSKFNTDQALESLYLL